MTTDPIGPATCRAAADLARAAVQILDLPAAAEPDLRGEAARMLRSAAFLINPPGSARTTSSAPAPPDPAAHLLEALAQLPTVAAVQGPPGATAPPRALRSIDASPRTGPTPADVPRRRPSTSE